MRERNPGNILVAFYSRSGTTRTVANEIAQLCGADLEELRDIRGRQGMFGYFRSAREAIRGLPADIAPPSRDATGYDTLIIGTPVWAGHVASPVRGYLSLLARQGVHPKRVAFFCTMGGRGADTTFTDLASLVGAQPLTTLSLTTHEVQKHRFSDKIAAFAGQIAINKDRRSLTE